MANTSANTHDDNVESDDEERNHPRNILILGTIGSGKATLANNIAKEKLFDPQDNIHRELCIRSKHAAESNLTFMLIDTFGSFHLENCKDQYSYDRI